jgi:hypothetical protein
MMGWIVIGIVLFFAAPDDTVAHQMIKDPGSVVAHGGGGGKGPCCGD